MKYRAFGNTGWEVSEVGFGAWAIGGGWGPQSDSDSVATLHRALDLGVNFIDTAAGYGGGRSEQIIGQVLKTRKERVYVATKTPPQPGPWPPSPYCKANDRYSEAYLRRNVEERLRNLQVDCIDLLQLHTWTRAWNQHPTPLEILRKLRDEGKIANIGLSTPETDQDAFVDLMRGGWLDGVQVIYNLFEQQPAAEFLPTAQKHGVGVIVRVAFDEAVLTGKYTADHTFPEGDFRRNYFAGDRLGRAVKRVEAIKQTIAGWKLTLPQVALKFVLSHPAVSTVIPGIRSAEQAVLNAAVPELPDLTEEQLAALRQHAWPRSFWYAGK